MSVYKGGSKSLATQAHPLKFRSQGSLPIGNQAAQSRLGFVMAQKENGGIGPIDLDV